MTAPSKSKTGISRRVTVGTKTVDELFAAIEKRDGYEPPPNGRNANQLALIWGVSIAHARNRAEAHERKGTLVYLGKFRRAGEANSVKYWAVK